MLNIRADADDVILQRPAHKISLDNKITKYYFLLNTQAIIN